MADSQTLASQLQSRFGDKIVSTKLQQKQVTMEISPESLIEICTALRDEPEFAFEMLMDLCGVDYLVYGKDEWQTDLATETGFSRGVQYSMPYTVEEKSSPDEKRFAVVYHLLSIRNNHRLRLRVFVKNSQFPVLDSVNGVWNSANWYEREAFDLFGIIFEGHPDLRRILTDYGFIGHPFRKDFPLSGQVEMRYDPEKGRVVYEPVTIEPRVLVPRVIREDHRYQVEQSGEKVSDA